MTASSIVSPALRPCPARGLPPPPNPGGNVVARRRDGHRLQSAGQISRAIAQDFEIPFFDDKIAAMMLLRRHFGAIKPDPTKRS